MIRTLERVAVGGLATSLALLALDAIVHRGPRFLWMMPHHTWMHQRWAFAAALFRLRPALAGGMLLLCLALFIALTTMLLGVRDAIARTAERA